MDIHQCPRCELRFVHTSELRHHFEFDHAADPSVFEPYRYRSQGPGSAEHPCVLLVGNQTLEREGLVDEVVARASDARVFVVVPVTGTEPHAATLAQHRLRAVLDRLRTAGVEADGEVGVTDPYAATCHALAERHVTEILLSTLPASSSRWLGVALPDRLRRHTARPVTVLTPAPVGHETG